MCGNFYAAVTIGDSMLENSGRSSAEQKNPKMNSGKSTCKTNVRIYGYYCYYLEFPEISIVVTFDFSNNLLRRRS